MTGLVTKRFSDPRAAERERFAYLHWAPATSAPRLIESIGEPPMALVLSEVTGRPCRTDQGGDDLPDWAWPAFGDALRRLHAADPAPGGRLPEVDVAAEVAADLEHLRTAVAGRLDRTADSVVATVDLAVFAGAPLVPCHGDFRPRNWIVDLEARAVHVIDFEHAHVDLAATDIANFWRFTFAARPAGWAGFAAGYGVDDRLLAQIAALRVIAALRRVAVGSTIGDDALVAAGRWELADLAAQASG